MKKRHPVPPLVRRAEKIGMKPSTLKTGKYRIGYKLAWKMKRELKIFFIRCCRLTAQQSRDDFKEQFDIDWNNPYTLNW